MSAVGFTRRAEVDLATIADYTLREWGEEQTVRYVEGIEACCQLLADNPAIGRSCDYIRPGLHRMESGSHVIFYRHEPQGILVSRVLHKRMSPERNLADDENSTP